MWINFLKILAGRYDINLVFHRLVIGTVNGTCIILSILLIWISVLSLPHIIHDEDCGELYKYSEQISEYLQQVSVNLLSIFVLIAVNFLAKTMQTKDEKEVQ